MARYKCIVYKSKNSSNSSVTSCGYEPNTTLLWLQVRSKKKISESMQHGATNAGKPFSCFGIVVLDRWSIHGCSCSLSPGDDTITRVHINDIVAKRPLWLRHIYWAQNEAVAVHYRTIPRARSWHSKIPKFCIKLWAMELEAWASDFISAE